MTEKKELTDFEKLVAVLEKGVCTEAPASLNVRFFIGEYSFQLTLRGAMGSEVLTKVPDILDIIAKMGGKPRPFVAEYPRIEPDRVPEYEEPDDEAPVEQPRAGWCEVHGCEMKRYEKGGQHWYSPSTVKNNKQAWCSDGRVEGVGVTRGGSDVLQGIGEGSLCLQWR